MESVKDYAIFMLDLAGKVTSWNAGAERMLGYSEEEAIGKHFAAFFVPEDVQAGAPEVELKEARENGRASDERWHLRKDGSRFWASGVTTPLVDNPLPDDASPEACRCEGPAAIGVFRGYAKVMRDLTEQKLSQDALTASAEQYRRLSQELEELNRRKDMFLAMLSHELRNPLAPILTALQLVRQSPFNEAVQLQAHNIIERQARQLAHLVDDLLEASRMTAGKIQLRKEPIELQTIVMQAIETARPFIDAREHQLTVSLPPQPIVLNADPLRLEQVVLNLLTNAAKYTPERGQITVTLGLEDGVATIRVQDNGIGIARDLLPRIFELFTQAEQGLDRTQGGLGIGLALVKSLVQMHKGRIEVASEVGQGTEFTVRLPLDNPQDLPRNVVPQPVPQKTTGGLRVLVVDDNVDAANSLATLLRFDGHHVRAAHGGLAALSTASDFEPSVVLLDIGLPGLDGYQIARRLRERPETENAFIVAVTGYGLEADRQHAREAGFDHHIVKPVDPAELQGLLANLAGQQA